MAAKVETRLAFTRQTPTEPALNKMDASTELSELPNVVQCGTIEDLLHHMAPQQGQARAPQCWEDAWQQILQVMGSEPLTKTMSSGEPQTEGIDAAQENAKPAGMLEQPATDVNVPPEITPTLPFPPKNMWMLHFQIDEDIEACLETFEWMAYTHHWPREQWVARLKPYLSCKALLACNVLGHDVVPTYDAVKESILCRYGITPEMQRRGFREFRYQEAKGPRKAYQKLRMLGRRWLKPEKHTKEQILELLLLEQFLAILPQEMQSWVRERSPQTCTQAVELAEGFQLRNEPPIPLEDVCVKFSEEEWAFLTEEQRALYRDIVLENFQNASALGIPQEKPSLIKQIQEERIPCFQDYFPRGDSQDNPFTGFPLENLDVIRQMPKEGIHCLQDDALREDLQESPLTGASLEKPEVIKQAQELGIPCFPDDTLRGDSQDCHFRENARLPNSTEKRIASKKAEMEMKEKSTAAGVTQDGLDSSRAPEGEFLRSEKQRPQPLKPRPVRTSPSRSHPRKKQVSASKGQPPKRKKQPPPTASEPHSGGKRLQLPSPGEMSGGIGSDATVSTHKSLKQKKRPKGQEGPPKLKKQPMPTGKSPKLRNKTASDDEPPTLKKGPQQEKKAPLQKKRCRQPEEKQQPLPLAPSRKPHAGTLSVITWHPPFSATVVSDLTCVECGRTFRQRADLRHHQYVHTQEKPYACTVCDKCFRHPSNLHIHLRIHSGEKPYRCPECGRTFSQSCNLRTHRKIHTDSKPFNCCVCGKTFRHRANLTIHQRIHTGERPYSCSVCPKRFCDRSSLVQHERVHTGERPYACRVCDQKFSQISHLIKHCRVHPGARGPPKSKTSGGRSLSPPKNGFSRSHGKDSFRVTAVNKQDQKSAWVSKTWVSPAKPDPPQTGTTT
ncbi:uncharacterized protein LOC110081779 [Pogona vitticeps]